MSSPIPLVELGRSGLRVSAIGLGTMTFGEQVAAAEAFTIMDRAFERGVNWLDTAEMYAIPPRAATYGATERIIGQWLAARPGVCQRVRIASKVAGPSRGLDWIRGPNTGLTSTEIISACEGSLRRLGTEAIDLYQIHWPARHVPMFGGMYYQPQQERPSPSLLEQLQALAQLVQQGKVRAVGLSNETPYGVHEFVRLAEQFGLPRVASVQNPYCLINRSYENGLDETCYRLGVGLLAYSPLGFGLLTGKYDASGFEGPAAPVAGRMARFASMRQQRWGRPAALEAARRYNALARAHGLTPTALALAFCYTKWQVASTIIGVTSLGQLDECLDAWGTRLSTPLLAEIDAIRLELRDPAI